MSLYILFNLKLSNKYDTLINIHFLFYTKKVLSIKARYCLFKKFIL